MAITRANRLSLQEHMDHLGLNSRKLGLQTGVEQAAIDRALTGQPIAYEAAMRICRYLSKEHKVSTKDGAGFQPEHIRGLQTWMPTDYDPQERQVRAASAEITRLHQQEATRAAVERALRTPEVQALVRSLRARKPAPRVASHPSIITRRAATPDLRQMQADLAVSRGRLAELEKRVRRERAGVR